MLQKVNVPLAQKHSSISPESKESLTWYTSVPSVELKTVSKSFLCSRTTCPVLSLFKYSSTNAVSTSCSIKAHYKA